MSDGIWNSVIDLIIEEECKKNNSIHKDDVIRIMMDKYYLSENNARYAVEMYTEDMYL